MNYFVLFCDCGCNDPLLTQDKRGEHIAVYRSRELAHLAAAEIKEWSRGSSPVVGEIEVKRIENA